MRNCFFSFLRKKKLIRLFYGIGFLLFCSLTSRGYYHFTGGFFEGHIYPIEGEIVSGDSAALSPAIQGVLQQPFFWLGKGCQSYVFESQDGQTVIKFIKHQRMRPKPWHAFFMQFPWEKIPYLGESSWIASLRAKEEKKRKKLNALKRSWEIVAENLSEETGILYAHTKKTENKLPSLTLFDKMGLAHEIALDEVEFVIQKKAVPLLDYIELKSGEGRETWRLFFKDLVALILGEYRRGFADNDQALMQNTGVLGGRPIHVDVGQFEKSKKIQEPSCYRQHLFDKMYKFREWLKYYHPVLRDELDAVLEEIFDNRLREMTPTHWIGGVALLEES